MYLALFGAQCKNRLIREACAAVKTVRYTLLEQAVSVRISCQIHFLTQQDCWWEVTNLYKKDMGRRGDDGQQWDKIECEGTLFIATVT